MEVDYPEPHRERAKEILRAHPDVRQLFGRNGWSALIIAGVVAGQLGVAWLIRDSGWWVVLAVAWLVGAFANHSLWVLIHECTHNLVARRGWHNQALAILANVPMVLPSAISFRIYHLKHHQFQGDYDLDADLAGEREARFVGRSTLRKAIWELFFPVFQSVRVARFSKTKKISFVTPAVLANITVQLTVDALVVILMGPAALIYLVASTLFSVGLHPLGARWIQEHFVVEPGQETYSYYGPLNTLALNVGYHVEHHDFPFVPWSRLPRLKATAPEHYEPLVSHQSWTGLWLRFLRDPNLTLYSRITRDGRINRKRPMRPSGTVAPGTVDREPTEAEAPAEKETPALV